MARSKKLPMPVEVDDGPSPAKTLALIGHEEALSRVARAIRAGRPPQGLLLGGPPGIGKATLAYRIARYLLRYGATDAGPADLSLPENDPVTAQVSAAAHPGLLALSRPVNVKTGKLMTVLPVDEIRRLSPFFGMTSGAGGWRVAIVDTADDMNDNAANALLKALEEPPPRAMLIVLAHHPGRLLPTIRSRCQRIDLRPLTDAQVGAGLQLLAPQLDAGARASIAPLAGGSLGAALQLAEGDGLQLAKDAQTLIDNRATPDIPALLALGDRLARMTDGLDSFGTYLFTALSERIRAKAGEGAQLEKWVEAAEAIRQSFLRSDGLHLDPRQTVLSSATALRQLK